MGCTGGLEHFCGQANNLFGCARLIVSSESSTLYHLFDVAGRAEHFLSLVLDGRVGLVVVVGPLSEDVVMDGAVVVVVVVASITRVAYARMPSKHSEYFIAAMMLTVNRNGWLR